MNSSPDSNGTTIRLQGPLTTGCLSALASRGPLQTLSIHDDAVFGLRQARKLLALPGIDWLRVFCTVTRAAASLLLEVPGLRVLDMFQARAGGTLRGFDVPRGLERFHWSWYALQPTDFAAIAQSPTLRALGTDHSVITPATLDALLAMPRLEWLSLESSNIDDVLASRLRTGTPLRSLFLANNPLTRTGLDHIVALKSLRELDLWETAISLDDLELLEALPQLEYLSIGCGDPEHATRRYDPDRLLPLLARLPLLQRLELDGIALDETQRAAFAARFAELKLVER